MEDLSRKVTGLLRSSGYIKSDGRKGAHEKWRNDIIGVQVLLPRNLKSRHTANAILKSALINSKL